MGPFYEQTKAGLEDRVTRAVQAFNLRLANSPTDAETRAGITLRLVTDLSEIFRDGLLSIASRIDDIERRASGDLGFEPG